MGVSHLEKVCDYINQLLMNRRYTQMDESEYADVSDFGSFMKNYMEGVKNQINTTAGTRSGVWVGDSFTRDVLSVWTWC